MRCIVFSFISIHPSIDTILNCLIKSSYTSTMEGWIWNICFDVFLHHFLTKTNSPPASVSKLRGVLLIFWKSFLNAIKTTSDFLFFIGAIHAFFVKLQINVNRNFTPLFLWLRFPTSIRSACICCPLYLIKEGL